MDVLRDHEARLWLADPETIEDPEILRSFDALMSRDERERRDRFRFEKDQRRFLVTRALVRTVLSRYASVGPEGWRFVSNRYGHPSIDYPAEARSLRFNLSRTRGLVACLVGRQPALGVDVEDRQRPFELLDVADRFFAPAEVKALRALPPAAHRARFFLYWTLKESYIKARGMGLAIPLAQFAFDVDTDPTRIRVAFDPRLQDDPKGWQFAVVDRRRAHAIAVSLKRDLERQPDEAVRVAVREWIASKLLPRQ